MAPPGAAGPDRPLPAPPQRDPTCGSRSRLHLFSSCPSERTCAALTSVSRASGPAAPGAAACAAAPCGHRTPGQQPPLVPVPRRPPWAAPPAPTAALCTRRAPPRPAGCPPRVRRAKNTGGRRRRPRETRLRRVAGGGTDRVEDTQARWTRRGGGEEGGVTWAGPHVSEA